MKIPYKLTAAVSLEKRRENMLAAIARNLPRLDQQPMDDAKTIHVACYGPSLVDTWQDIKHPCISVSGATRFLADRGFVPDYHCDMDPRPYKVKQITPPVHGVKYLLASVCAPIYFDTLKDEEVILWHCVSGAQDDDLIWLSQQDPGQLLISTGSNVGLAAIQLGGILGYRHFEIHGMDGSHAEDGKQRHAGEHFGKVQEANQIWRAQGHPYKTSKIMANGVAETLNSCKYYPIFTVFHGTGLTQALIEEADLPNACTARQVEKAEKVRKSRPLFTEIPGLDRKDIRTPSAWEPLYVKYCNPAWIPELQEMFEEADKLREKARYNTGSISLESALLLRSVCAWKQPRVIAEVGTFIGKSTRAMSASEMIYTCDKDNDCLETSEKIKTFPFYTSTDMFRKLIVDGVKVDLFFFDGRLTDEDIPLILELAAPDAVYVVDDYTKKVYAGGVYDKGVENIVKLIPKVGLYGFMAPYKGFGGRSSLAMLVPVKTKVVRAE